MNSAVMMLERTAARFPDKTAVRDEWESLTFRELRGRALSAATGLMNVEGTGNGLRPVVVYLPKSADAIACFVGAMYAGQPYVPVAADIPMLRLQTILKSLRQGHIITSPELAKNLEGLDLTGFALHLSPELRQCPADEKRALERLAGVADIDPIYIMYTSGSTGTPKGVTIPHRGILDYARWLKETFDFDENTVLGNQSALYFDNSTLDIYTMMYTGAELVIIPEVLFRFPGKLPEFVEAEGINTIFWVPTVMIAVANSGVLEQMAMPKLKKVLFCGEAMPNRQLNIWRKCHPDALYANLYGPTEITDVCTCYIVDREFADADPLPIGRACRNMRTVVLTEEDREAAVGETGELCVLGSGLALGYWNAPELTRNAFIQNPLCPDFDQRLYRTGDLAYVAEDGLLMFVGRKDSQIKLRGNRIELGEVETAAKTLSGVENACVLFDSEKEEIVLFAQTKESLILRKVNLELRRRLPAYMLPGRLVCMESLPQTPNGKIDRVKLRGTF